MRYSTLDEFGIDPAKLKWHTMPELTEAPSSEEDDLESAPSAVPSVEALTIAQAKRGLALTFRVPVEAVEITIRG